MTKYDDPKLSAIVGFAGEAHLNTEQFAYLAMLFLDQAGYSMHEQIRVAAGLGLDIPTYRSK